MIISTYWILFLSAALLLNISPGPDMIYLVTRTITHGKKSGFASMLGFGTGAMIHALFVSLGISAIISTSIAAFTVLKYTGAAYLFYLGIRSLISGGIKFEKPKENKADVPFISSYFQAVLVDITNPKVALFFMAFLPQFYRNNGTSRIEQFMTLGIIIVLMGFIIETAIVLLSDKISGVLRGKPLVSKIMDKLFGIILIALGTRLIFEKSK